jgi:hypothetical protein
MDGSDGNRFVTSAVHLIGVRVGLRFTEQMKRVTPFGLMVVLRTLNGPHNDASMRPSLSSLILPKTEISLALILWKRVI